MTNTQTKAANRPKPLPKGVREVAAVMKKRDGGRASDRRYEDMAAAVVAFQAAK